MRKWTEKEINIFIDLHKKGLRPKEIALQLNRTKNSILKKSDKLKLSFQKHPIISGSTYRNITIIKKIKRTIKGNSSFYLCQCKCGKIFELGRNSIVTGNSVSCGCIKKNNRIKTEGTSAKNRLFNQCKNNAKTRNLEFSLSKEEHYKIISQNCFYCDAYPSRYNPYLKKDGTLNNKSIKNFKMIKRAWILANTVERLNNNLGYFLDNCVASCWPCNKMRSNIEIDSFLSQIVKIYNFAILRKKRK